MTVLRVQGGSPGRRPSLPGPLSLPLPTYHSPVKIWPDRKGFDPTKQSWDPQERGFLSYYDGRIIMPPWSTVKVGSHRACELHSRPVSIRQSATTTLPSGQSKWLRAMLAVALYMYDSRSTKIMHPGFCVSRNQDPFWGLTSCLMDIYWGARWWMFLRKLYHNRQAELRTSIMKFIMKQLRSFATHHFVCSRSSIYPNET